MSATEDVWTSPELKLELSPAESFLSSPGEMYPPLFGVTNAKPTDLASPPMEDDELEMEDSTMDQSSPAADDETKSEKKTKKRKSWGQVLPEPKTNLPPRKRAKTEDEKEQRRVERVLRNRRAAQSSRERKRQEVELLETRNRALEQQLLHFQKLTQEMYLELQMRRREAGVTTADNPDGLTLTSELFRSQDAIAQSAPSPTATLADSKSLVDEMLRTQVPSTVNPASIRSSPAPEESLTDSTQHPAVSVGQDSKSAPAGDVFGDAPLDGSEAALADSLVLASGCFDSPSPTDTADHYLAGDSTFTQPFDFDINEYLNNQEWLDDSTPRNVSDKLAALPVPPPSSTQEDSNLQPQPGASTIGCDAGGIAVGTD